MAITIKEIAKVCGVSEGTVDRAIHNRFGISDKTRARVLETIKELNYRPNQLAQSLATGTTKTIGIICFDLENNYFAVLVDIIEGIAKEKGYFINLILTHGDSKKEIEGISYLSERQVDGLIIFSVCSGEEYISYIKDLNIPIVTIYNRISPDFTFVAVDAKQAMRDAVHYISGKGYERIIFLNARVTQKMNRNNNVYTLTERQNGYLEGISEQQLHAPIVIEGLDQERILQTIQECKPYKTAVLCISDMYALAVLELCKKYGIRVPEELGIMGYDNMDMLKYIHPRICSVGYEPRMIGERVFDILYDMMINHNKSEDCILDYCFSEGDSL